MKKYLPDTIILTIRAFMLILIMASPFLINQVQAQEKDKEKKKKKSVPVEVELGFTTIYDNNILKYSEKYLERFKNNEDNGRFHIETYDDIILSPSLKLSSTFRIFKKLNSKFNIDYSQNSYIVNDIKNWRTIGVGFQQFLTKKASLRISYSYIPDFYVRHFRDGDWVKIYRYIPETFQPYSFAKDNYGFWIQNTFLKNTRVRLLFNYAVYYHNEHFTEYDCKNYVYGFKLFQPLHKKVRLEFGYQFLTSDAKAYDEPGETSETSDDADADNEEDSFVLGVYWQLPPVKKLNHNIGGEFEFLKRYYTTDNYLEEDEEHAGRIDESFGLLLTYEVKVLKSLKTSVYYELLGRNSGSKAEANREYLSLEKDYRQTRIGFDITYNLNF